MSSLFSAWDACERKLDALFDLRLSGEISPDEFAKHKEKLLQEKHKYEELMDDSNNRVETWLDRAGKIETLLTIQKQSRSRRPEPWVETQG